MINDLRKELARYQVGYLEISEHEMFSTARLIVIMELPICRRFILTFSGINLLECGFDGQLLI